MPSIFGNIFEISLRPSVWDEHGEDIIQKALDRIAQDVQNRVRSRIDTGLDAKAALRAQAITVRNDSGQLVIKTDSTDQQPEETTDDLFTASADPPAMHQGKLVFRQIQMQQRQRQNRHAVMSSVEEVMTLKFTDHIDEAAETVTSQNPEFGK